METWRITDRSQSSADERAVGLAYESNSDSESEKITALERIDISTRQTGLRAISDSFGKIDLEPPISATAGPREVNFSFEDAMIDSAAQASSDNIAMSNTQHSTIVSMNVPMESFARQAIHSDARKMLISPETTSPNTHRSSVLAQLDGTNDDTATPEFVQTVRQTGQRDFLPLDSESTELEFGQGSERFTSEMAPSPEILQNNPISAPKESNTAITVEQNAAVLGNEQSFATSEHNSVSENKSFVSLSSPTSVDEIESPATFVGERHGGRVVEVPETQLLAVSTIPDESQVDESNLTSESSARKTRTSSSPQRQHPKTNLPSKVEENQPSLNLTASQDKEDRVNLAYSNAVEEGGEQLDQNGFKELDSNRQNKGLQNRMRTSSEKSYHSSDGESVRSYGSHEISPNKKYYENVHAEGSDEFSDGKGEKVEEDSDEKEDDDVLTIYSTFSELDEEEIAERRRRKYEYYRARNSSDPDGSNDENEYDDYDAYDGYVEDDEIEENDSHINLSKVYDNGEASDNKFPHYIASNMKDQDQDHEYTGATHLANRKSQSNTVEIIDLGSDSDDQITEQPSIKNPTLISEEEKRSSYDQATMPLKEEIMEPKHINESVANTFSSDELTVNTNKVIHFAQKVDEEGSDTIKSSLTIASLKQFNDERRDNQHHRTMLMKAESHHNDGEMQIDDPADITPTRQPSQTQLPVVGSSKVNQSSQSFREDVTKSSMQADTNVFEIAENTLSKHTSNFRENTSIEKQPFGLAHAFMQGSSDSIEILDLSQPDGSYARDLQTRNSQPSASEKSHSIEKPLLTSSQHRAAVPDSEESTDSDESISANGDSEDAEKSTPADMTLNSSPEPVKWDFSPDSLPKSDTQSVQISKHGQPSSAITTGPSSYIPVDSLSSSQVVAGKLSASLVSAAPVTTPPPCSALSPHPIKENEYEVPSVLVKETQFETAQGNCNYDSAPHNPYAKTSEEVVLKFSEKDADEGAVNQARNSPSLNGGNTQAQLASSIVSDYPGKEVTVDSLSKNEDRETEENNREIGKSRLVPENPNPWLIAEREIEDPLETKESILQPSLLLDNINETLLSKHKSVEQHSSASSRRTSSSSIPTFQNPGLRKSSSSYYHPLINLDAYLNSQSDTIDVIAVTVRDTKPPSRASAGPKDYFTILRISDPSAWPTKLQVQVFRPWKGALPVAQVGDVILLRSFRVKSRKREIFLMSCEESAWCVWRGEETECRGPPVDRGSDEDRAVVRLRTWWSEKKHEKANKKEESSKVGERSS